jgi:hypothetical protein
MIGDTLERRLIPGKKKDIAAESDGLVFHLAQGILRIIYLVGGDIAVNIPDRRTGSHIHGALGDRDLIRTRSKNNYTRAPGGDDSKLYEQAQAVVSFHAYSSLSGVAIIAFVS